MTAVRLAAHVLLLALTSSPSRLRQSVGLPLRMPFGGSSLPGGGTWDMGLKWDRVGP